MEFKPWPVIRNNYVESFDVVISERKKEELTRRINNEFEKYYAQLYKQIEEDKGCFAPERAEEITERRLREARETYFEADLFRKISILANNFCVWWPGKMYRNPNFSQQKNNRKQIIADLDRLLTECGYTNVDIFARDLSETAREQKFLVIADLFFQMRDLGYTWDELAR